MATQINQDNWRYHLRRGITDLWFILSVSVALLLLFILLGYHNTDPGWSTSGNEDEIKHWFGATGAYIADALFSLTGYACYLLPLGLVLIGWQSTRRTYIDAELLGWKFFALFFSLIALAGILTLRGGAAPINSLAITAGGVIGQKMNIELLKIWSVPVIMMVYTALFVLGVTLMAEFPWLRMLEKIGFYVTLLFRKLDNLDGDDGVTDRRKPSLQDDEISRRRRENLRERVKVIDLDAQAHKEYAENYSPSQPSFNIAPPTGAGPSFNITPTGNPPPPPAQPQYYSQAVENQPPQQPPAQPHYSQPVENRPQQQPPAQPQYYSQPVENQPQQQPPAQPHYSQPVENRPQQQPPTQPQYYSQPVENQPQQQPPAQPQYYSQPVENQPQHQPPAQPRYSQPVENQPPQQQPPQASQDYSQSSVNNPPPTSNSVPPQSQYSQPVVEERSEPILSWAKYKTLYEQKVQNEDLPQQTINTTTVTNGGASHYPQEQAIPMVTTPMEYSAAPQVMEEHYTMPTVETETTQTVPAHDYQPYENPQKEADVQQIEAEKNQPEEEHQYTNYQPRHHITPEAAPKPTPLTAVNDDSPIIPEAPQEAVAEVQPLTREKKPLRVRLNTFQDTPIKEYPLPPLDLLNVGTTSVADYSAQELDEMAMRLENALKNYKLNVRVENIAVGPVVTRLELSLAPGVKVSQISNLEKDIARSLAVPSVRVVEVIPGKPFIGLEMPNAKREIVPLRGILESGTFRRETSPLTMVLGVDVGGKPMVANLADMPHLLVAGTTGSGKSVGINVMLASMLFKSRPDDLKLILIDPKRLEMTFYEDIPHLLTPVITDMLTAENAFCWAVAEMERRYQLMAAMKVRKIDEFNRVITEAKDRGSTVANPFYRVGTDTPPTLKKLPYIVIVVDELADLMMVAGKNVEQLIARIAQKARAAGIHLILATQRPSVDVITGLIKANIPTRIAFQVSSKIDSRIILDNQGAGAESLLGYGDMLYAPAGKMPLRIHGAFIDDQETDRLTSYLRAQDRPQYEPSITAPVDVSTMGAFGAAGIIDSNG